MGAAISLHWLGLLAGEQEDHSRAAMLHAEGLARRWAAGAVEGVPFALADIATLAAGLRLAGASGPPLWRGGGGARGDRPDGRSPRAGDLRRGGGLAQAALSESAFRRGVGSGEGDATP